jgi:ABC-type dipeptide/oligopeptide/nickel transport system permease component
MWRIIGKRIFSALPNLVGVVIITFILTRALPGDPAAFFAGPSGTTEAVEQIRQKLGLDKSLVQQFGVYLQQLAKGDLGVSLNTGQPVLTEVIQRLPASLELTFMGLGLALLISIPLGIAAATRPGTWIDHLCRLVTTAGVSLPTFFTGLLLSYVFYLLLGIAPSPIGRLDPYFSPPPPVTGFYLIDSLLVGDIPLFFAAFKQLLLPAITLGLFVLAPLARMTRASMLSVLSSDYIRTAKSFGLERKTVLVTYAFHNALLPVLTTLGMVFSFLLGSNVLVEKVFAWPGIGSFAVESLIASDYAPVQGFVLTMAVLYVLLNLLIDLLYTVIDPRVRLEG